MIKRACIAILFLSTVAFGQNTMRFSQINFAQGVNNPAAIAIDGSIMVDLIFRNQWFGIDGAPTSGAFNGQYEFDQSMAAGLTMSYDRIGVNQTTSVGGQYAYRLVFDDSRTLGFGIGLGIDNLVSHLAGSQTTQANDPAFASSYSKVFFNGSFGLFYNSPKFYIGGSIPRLFQNTNSDVEPGFQPPRWHYYVSTGWYLGNKRYTFNPHIQLKGGINMPFQADLVLRNTFINRFSINVGYRSENSIIAGFDVLITNMARIGYSFNYDIGSLARVKGASNELYLGLAFPYHDDRNHFDRRRYINKKGGGLSDHKRHSRKKHFRRGRKYGRKHKYR